MKGSFTFTSEDMYQEYMHILDTRRACDLDLLTPYLLQTSFLYTVFSK